MPTSTKKLKQLTVTKVSLVPRGSNPGAHIAIFKSNADTPPVTVNVDHVEKATFNELLLAEQKRKALWKIADSIYTMQDAMYSSIYSDNADAEIRKSVKEFGAYVNGLLDALKSNSLDGDADVAKQLVQKKAEGTFARLFSQEIPMSKQAVVETPPVEKTEAQVEEVKLSELPPAVQKMIADQQEAIAKAQAAADAANAVAKAAQEQVAKETEARELLECEKEAQAEIGFLPGTPQQLGKMLYDLKKALTPEGYASQLTILKAGSAAVQAQMLNKGLDTPGAASADSAEAKLNAMADEIMKADPKITHRAVALTKAYEKAPALYKEYQKEEKAAGRRA